MAVTGRGMGYCYFVPTGRPMVAGGGAQRNPRNNRTTDRGPNGANFRSIPHVPFIPDNPVHTEELAILVLKGLLPVVFLLTLDVTPHAGQAIPAD